MEKMPYRSEMEDCRAATDIVFHELAIEGVVSSDWRMGLPVLTGAQVVLRDLRTSDAASLFALLTTEEVSRFISPPPTTVEGFEKFIGWAHCQRRAGAYACFAVTLANDDTAIGIFQLRELEPGFGTAEWGFAIGSPYWGTGVFQEGADLMVSFAFERVGVHRLEARAAARNGRGNGALRKMGAVQEGLLRKSFLKNGEYLDQVLWTILDEDWQARPSSLSYATMTIH
jgi:RimJ/RimL family protein N-acetyltransferase